MITLVQDLHAPLDMHEDTQATVYRTVTTPADRCDDEGFFDADTLPNFEPPRWPVDVVPTSRASLKAADDGSADIEPPSQAAILESMSCEAFTMVERYEDALKRVDDVATLAALERIKRGHLEAFHRLQAATQSKGGTPDIDRATVGRAGRLAGHAAVPMDDAVLVDGLEAGETLRRLRLVRAVDRDDLDEDVKRMLRRHVIPQQQRHIDALSHLRHQLFA